MQSYELCCDMIDVVIDLSSIYRFVEIPENNILFFIIIFFSTEESAFDNKTSSLIKLNNSTVLYLREVNKFLALVCILREENFNKQGVIDYNFLCFRDAIVQVFELKVRTRKQIEEDFDQDYRNDESLMESPNDSVAF